MLLLHFSKFSNLFFSLFLAISSRVEVTSLDDYIIVFLTQLSKSYPTSFPLFVL